MSLLASEIRPGAYADSIVLMQLQSALAAEPGIEDAGVVMGTAPNLELLEANGLLAEEVAGAAADDLVIVVRSSSDEAARAALARIDALMVRKGGEAAEDFRPRSLRSAARLLPSAQWVGVSVPGRYATGVARDALDLGRHVFLYSDNVSIEEEAELKARSAAAGRLVMGPDCGTAIVNGVGLGFANRVRRGGIGLVGASGTGLQAITARIHQLGAGVSQAIGTGGRDLSEEIGGTTALQALDLLARDEATRVIVIVSKPPAPAVADRLLAAARATSKPVVVDFLGFPPAAADGDLHFAGGLSETADLAVSLLGNGGGSGANAGQRARGEAAEVRAPVSGHLRGLFAGGTLALEAQLTLRGLLDPIHSNAPVTGTRPIDDPMHSAGHVILDLGADEFTVGRLHPMMDQDLRLRRLRQEAADPETGLILLDVVLGEGSHPDPASELAPATAEIVAAGGPEVVFLVVGTDEDPQGLSDQVDTLREAGAAVFEDVAEALAHVAQRFGGSPPDAAAERGAGGQAEPATTGTGSTESAGGADTSLPAVDAGALGGTLGLLNAGLETFHHSALAQGADSVQLDWRPPAAGDERLMAILEKMK